MRTRNDTTRPTSALDDPTAAVQPKRRARASRATTRRRPRSVPADAMIGTSDAKILGPISLYRQEKAARSVAAADAALMAEAKRAYDELVAESGMKRAGMRGPAAASRRAAAASE